MIQFWNPFFPRLNQVHDLCNVVADIVTAALEYSLDFNFKLGNDGIFD